MPALRCTYGLYVYVIFLPEYIYVRHLERGDTIMQCPQNCKRILEKHSILGNL